jgi:hypothetical protein
MDLKWTLVSCFFFGCVWCRDKDGTPQPPKELLAYVGGHAVFNCELDFPQDLKIPFILKWNKGVSIKCDLTIKYENEFCTF